jgi:hypothetical protein
MSHADFLRGRLAREIDFDQEGSEDLLSFYLNESRHNVAGNPSISEETVSSLLGVGTTHKPLPADVQASLVRRHQFDEQQKAHLLAREKRVGVWGAFIQSQELVDREFDEFVALDRGEDASNYLINHASEFFLEGDPRLLQILEQSAPVVRLNYLSSHPGSFVEQAPRWISEYLKSNFGYSVRLEYCLLRRPDLLDALRAQTETRVKVLVILAGCEHDAEQQLVDVGLSAALALTPGSESYFSAIHSWRWSCKDQLEEAIRSPFTRRRVLETLRTVLRDGLSSARDESKFQFQKSLGHLRSRFDVGEATGRWEIVGDYSTITEREEFAWLATWISSRARQKLDRNLIGAAKALENPFLPDDLRAPFEEIAAKLARCESTVFLAKRPEGIGRPVPGLDPEIPIGAGGLSFATAKEYQQIAKMTCIRVCTYDFCGRRHCSVGERLDFESMTLHELHTQWLSAATKCVQSTPFGEWLHGQLGSDPAAHHMFFALAQDWAGTARELLETSRVLTFV